MSIALAPRLPDATYIRTWQRWEAFAAEATRQGSGPTREQETGAAMMLSWLLDHDRLAARAVAAYLASPEFAEQLAVALHMWFGEVLLDPKKAAAGIVRALGDGT